MKVMKIRKDIIGQVFMFALAIVFFNLFHGRDNFSIPYMYSTFMAGLVNIVFF
jgi:hypothetical protein